ncbi:MAG: fasciclin domain-containing protein [Parvibaculaceae bacterium]
MKINKTLSAFAFAASVALASPALAAGNLYDTLKGDPQFSTLVSVIDATGTKHNYTGGERTVFAPTNAAFEAIKGGYSDMLGKTDRTNTQALLLYQIIPGKHTPASLAGKTTTTGTLQKAKVTISGTDGKLHYGDDKYGGTQAGAALSASNGVIVPLDAFPVPVFDTPDDGVPVPAPVTTRTPLN